jgi:hypothetical protein
MNSLKLAILKQAYKGQRDFHAKNQGYVFNLFSDIWTLGYKSNLNLTWTNDLDIDESVFIDLRLAIAHSAKSYASSSLIINCSTLKTIINYLNINDFNAWWLTLDDVYKRQVRNSLYSFCGKDKEYSSSTLIPLYDVAARPLKQKDGSKYILDSHNGSYSEVEHDNILESLRIATTQSLDLDILTTHQFTNLRNIIASQLMIATVRRSTQLRQIKWCDVLPVGQTFQSHKSKNRDWQPITQHLFSDVEQLHLRTFKGKDGEFRYNAEYRSHRLEPNLSILLLRYYHTYQQFLTNQLNEKEIIINTEEMKELMGRLPLLPDQSLFSSPFGSKEMLFRSVSETSEAYHQSSDSISTNIRYLFKKLKVESDRHPLNGVKLANNRWRHTQLTNAAWLGFTPAQIANITGVTIDAVKSYLDLKVKERVKIDKAYAGNHIIKRFDSISIQELQKNEEFILKNEFDVEIGYKRNPANCSSCQSKGGAPMACYPCDNFRPLETANHQQYLDKARRKLEINSQSGHPATVNKLKKIINYIEVTIALCNEKKIPKLEVK